MGKFREFIAYLIYAKEYKWLETVINKLCEWEMYIRGIAVRKVFGNFGKIPEGNFNSDTRILWDMCKCCGVNDEDDLIEYNLEL